ncbi:MAG: complex I NDUFA9 subunit family protein [Rhodospirillaceae bacterium]|nr:complex I NDUFA9 subunit family protein [Rhodospirillaceae bacterium]MBT7486995.1 complex I NDUFA9 subunit family protein [Rhodospirillales bacterium]MBT4701198.1 complex I NDUFA9 subunit family protein [Rhodospirillaceae bacterium]MBT5034202.1 complex I NDUFA9 subunit family protein [Rhodospirillaceae bacterium]MBT6219986.1 complex I NDUFA9 subunit family protein [Rhodospirillaceae bacterium]
MTSSVVTIFGGSGFLGRHLVNRLAKQDAVVRVAVRDPEAANFLKPMGDAGQVVPMHANINDDAQVRLACDGADIVINLVGLLSEWGKNTFKNVHADGALRVAKAAKDAGAEQFIQVSAIGASAKSPSAYAKTKAEGEAAVKKAFPGATIVRPSVIFGPEDQFFNRFAGLAQFSPMLPVFGCPAIPKLTLFGEKGALDVDIYGDGGTKFQPVYVGDVADGIMAILGTSKAAGNTYELGGPTIYSFKELMELVLRQTSRKKLLIPIPFWKAMIDGWFLQMLPKPLLTCDQVLLLKNDNIVNRKSKGFKDLGIKPVAAESILPTYLARFKTPKAHNLRTA